MFQERGLLNTSKHMDLRSPLTKFNLMRKLQEVKEQQSDDDDYSDTAVNDFSRLFIHEEDDEDEEDEIH